MEKKYLHTGIPVAAKMDGMSYMEPLGVWIGNNTEYGIEYLYWEKDTPCAHRMVAEAHVAFEVADVDQAVKESGGKVLLPTMSLGGTCKLAFVSIDNGPVVEFFHP